MTGKEQLLTDLAELEDGPLHRSLMKKRELVVANWTASNDPAADQIFKGEKRILDVLIDDIETAREAIRKIRSRPEVQMSKAF